MATATSKVRVDGQRTQDGAGLSVADAGDGIGDLIVGSADFSRAACIVYGSSQPDPADLNLANITTTEAARGSRIDGAAADRAGAAIRAG